MFPQVSPSPFAPRFRIPHDHRVLCALCFHGLTNCFSRNSFRFRSMQIAPGGVGVNQEKLSSKTVQGTLTSLQSSTYELLAAAKNGNLFVFSQIQTLWAKHPAWGNRGKPPLADVPNLASSEASKSVHSLASCRLPGLGAIIPLCTPNIRRCAFLSLADCPASLGGKTWLSALIGSTNEKHKQHPQMAIAICRRCILRGRASSPKRWSTSPSANISSPS